MTIVLAGPNVTDAAKERRLGKLGRGRQPCSVCRLQKTALTPYPTYDLNQLLVSQQSNRAIARRLSEYFQVPISYQSVRRHRARQHKTN